VTPPPRVAYAVEAWFGSVAPKNLPAAEVKRVHRVAVTALGNPEVEEAMARQGHVINVGVPEAEMPFFRAEKAQYAEIVKTAGVEAQ
jgi:tripartite-type tricarboxylate transporter receptor subunit TctC